MKVIVLLLILAILIPLASSDLAVRMELKGQGQISNMADYGDVRERAGGVGNYDYRSLNEQSDNAQTQTYQGSFTFNATNPGFTNRYSVAVNSKDVGVQQTIGTFGDKNVAAETSVALNPGLLQTDLTLTGEGTLNAWIWGSKSTAQVVGSQDILVRSHPTWLSETYGTGNFSIHQAISATPTPIMVPGAGNWLENPDASLNPNGTINEPAPAQNEVTTNSTKKIAANGLPAYRVSDHPELKKYLNNSTIQYESCPANGATFKTVNDPKLGRIQVYNQ